MVKQIIEINIEYCNNGNQLILSQACPKCYGTGQVPQGHPGVLKECVTCDGDGVTTTMEGQ